MKLYKKGRSARMAYYYNVLNFLIKLKRQGIVVNFQGKRLKDTEKRIVLLAHQKFRLTLLCLIKRLDLPKKGGKMDFNVEILLRIVNL